jgi:hypothetical protein
VNALAPIAPKLAKLLPVLASPADGEVVGAARAIDRTLRANGCDWHDLAAALERHVDSGELPESVHDVAAWCLARGGDLAAKERAFLENMLSWRQPSPGQRKWLCDIFARLRGDA